MALLECDFVRAREYLTRAKEVGGKSGHSQTTTAAQSNLGHLYLLLGDFQRAEDTFRLLMQGTNAGHLTRLAAADGLARVHLAMGNLDECESALRFIDANVGGMSVTSIYQARWSAVTRARLMIKLKAPQAATAILATAEADAESFGDTPLAAAIDLTRAQALAAAGMSKEASHWMVRASERGITQVRDLQPQYYAGVAKVLGDVASDLARHLRDRANRIWSIQGVISVRLEMDEPSDEHQPHSDIGTECIVDSLAALNDLAHEPRLLGNELVWIVRALGCSGTRLFESRNEGNVSAAAPRAVRLRLGATMKGVLWLECEVPDSPGRALLLADVLRIARGALELERARQEDRNRAAIWPAAPIEEQAGALFLAEEMQDLLVTARRSAATTAPVLITGETGTGKEVLARLIHLHSPRAAASFLPFNCSGVHKDMLDSQLFGHRKGAFTGATENFPGVIRGANGGTLFLDEIGELSLDVQPKLLRFLDGNEVHPIGETHPIRADVRLIAATNADLDTMVGRGQFREDLFYRLNIVRLHVPPLRERRVEIPALANHYLRKHAAEYHKENLRLAEETMEYLLLYRWPGNVRQIANEMRRMAALAEPGAVLMPEHLSTPIAASRRTIPASARTLESHEVVVRTDQPLPAAVQHVERTMIQRVLHASEGRLEEAAKILGLSRKGLYLKRRRYGLDAPENAEPVLPSTR